MPVPAPYVFGRSTTGPSRAARPRRRRRSRRRPCADRAPGREEAVERVEDRGARAAEERQAVDEQGPRARPGRRDRRRRAGRAGPDDAHVDVGEERQVGQRPGGHGRALRGRRDERPAAVDGERLAGHGARLVGQEVDRRVGHLDRGRASRPASGCLRDAYSRMCSSLAARVAIGVRVSDGATRFTRIRRRRRSRPSSSSARSARPWPRRRRASRTAPGPGAAVVTLPSRTSEPREPGVVRRLLAHRPDDAGAGQDLRPQVQRLRSPPTRRRSACGSGRRRTAGRCRRPR